MGYWVSAFVLVATSLALLADWTGRTFGSLIPLAVVAVVAIVAFAAGWVSSNRVRRWARSRPRPLSSPFT